MLDERDGMLERIGERIGAVILKTPEPVRLWLLVSVALKRSVIAKFMGMLERDIDERVDEARRHVATDVLNEEELAAAVVNSSKSHRVLVSFVDAAARRRAAPKKEEAAGKFGRLWGLSLVSATAAGAMATILLMPSGSQRVRTAPQRTNPFVEMMYSQFEALEGAAAPSGGVPLSRDAGNPHRPYEVELGGKLRALMEQATRSWPTDTEPFAETGDGTVSAEQWSFDGRTGQVVRVTAGSDAFDTVVRLLSPSGEELARDNDGGPGTDSQLEAALPATGRYVVDVTAYNDTGSGPYQVAVRTVPVRPLEEVGAGEITAEGGGDYWSFEGEAGQVVRITASSDAFDTVVRLLSDDGGRGTDSQLEAGLPAAGRYLVRVGALGIGTGPYQVAMGTALVRPLEGAGTGEITAEGGGDYWSFDGAAGQVVRITAGSDAFDTVVRLLSPSGEQLAWDDDGGRYDGGRNTDSQLEAVLPAAGRYLVDVAAYPGTGAGPYQVAMGPALVRPLEGAGTGEITAEGGGYYWSFDGVAGQVVRITAGSDAFDTVVRLLSPGGEELARDDDGGLGSDSQLEAALPAAGRYLVRVGAYEDITGPYQVAMGLVPVRALEGAGTGEITAEGGWDYWSFDGAAGQVVRITAGSDAFDTVVRLLSPGGEELARNGDGGLDTDSQLEAVLPAVGRYLVRVGALGIGTGPYQVAMGTALVRPLEGAGTGEITAEGGGDYWSFDGAAGQVVRITAGSDAFDTVVRLLSPGGEELARDDDGGLGTDSQLEAALPAAGRYLVDVAAYDGTGTYQVAVRSAPVRPLTIDDDATTGEFLRR